MEVFGAFLDEEWESLSKMFSFEDSDFMLHCDSNTVFSDEYSAGENVAAVNGNNLFFPSDHATIENNNNFYSCASQESSNSSELDSALLMGRAGGENRFWAGGEKTHNDTFESMGFFCQQNIDEGLMLPVFSDDVMDDILQLRGEMWNENLGNAGTQTAENGGSCMEMQLKRKFETPEIHAQDNSSENPKKKTRVSRDAQNNKKNTQSKRNKKTIQTSNDEELNNASGNVQSSSACCSEEDDSNNSDSKVSASNGKTKASKGPATDPQSLYARKRRERINERLRILQNLVPNGTKVDISTMLEEAVHYVKFLQLQIKLLSSDDMWMYAPIAYNGMDIGLYQRIVPNA